MGVQAFYDKEPHQLLQDGTLAECRQITVSGIPKFLCNFNSTYVFSCMYRASLNAFITTNKCKTIYEVSQEYVFIFYTLLYVSTFLCHHQEVLHLCLAKLHKFLKLKLLKLQFHKKY